jgi:polyferredoxin
LALRARRAGEGHARPIALWIFLAVLFVLQLWNNFGPPPGSVTELALMALASFLFLPIGAALVEWRRIRG